MNDIGVAATGTPTLRNLIRASCAEQRNPSESMNSPDPLVIADATKCGGETGTLGLLEPEGDSADSADSAADAHGMDLNAALQLLDALGVHRPRMRISGCDP